MYIRREVQNKKFFPNYLAMKHFFVILTLFSVQYVLAQAPDPEFNDKMALSEGKSRLKVAQFTESADYADYDLVSQRLMLEVDPAINFISGTVTSQVLLLNDNHPEISFDLSSALTVDSVKFDHKICEFQHNLDKIILKLPAGTVKDSYHLSDISYHGAPVQDGFGSFTVSQHNNVPVLWTLSEPYGAKNWWPCKQSLSDKIDSLNIFITCPAQYRAASNGRLVSDQVSGDKRTAHWRSHYPTATYLVAVAVTNYEAYSYFLDTPEGGKIEVINYMYPENIAMATSSEENVKSILSFYNSKFITYPFASEKYGHAQFGWGGGMEHQTMSFMYSLDYELVAHEMAHQWFGDYITLASWHDIWLNEGFATYLTGLVFENLQNGVWWPVWKDNQIKRITSAANGSVYVSDTTSIPRIFNSRLSYSKGAYLLHMLRWEMGDELFFKGLKNYLKDPQVSYGFASQQKFVEHMETAADTSFTEFFKDWYYGEGYPSFKLSSYFDSGKEKLQISQNPSDASVDFFEMHLPVRVWKNGNFKDLRLYNTTQNQEFVISDEQVDSVQFDPEKWLIAKADKVLKLQEITRPEKLLIINDFPAKKIRVLLTDFTGIETFQIYDVSGRAVLNGKLTGRDSWIDISTLSNYLYLVEIRAGNQKRMGKLLLSR